MEGLFLFNYILENKTTQWIGIGTGVGSTVLVIVIVLVALALFKIKPCKSLYIAVCI